MLPLVATVLRRYRYFRLSEGPRDVLFAMSYHSPKITFTMAATKHFRSRVNRDAHSGRGYSPWSPNAGDWPTATLQATLAEQRTALLRHSATAPSETRADHVSYTATLTTRSASFSPTPVLPQQCQSKSAAPLVTPHCIRAWLRPCSNRLVAP